MVPDRAENIDFDASLIDALDHRIQPLKRLLSPVSIGTEHIPRRGPVLLTGNHSIYGMVDIPMLGLEIYEKTGRTVRGLGDHNHFALPVWRDLLRRIGAVRGTREICTQLFEAGEAVLVFPGGGREVMKHKHERYQLIWKERVGFARLAIQHGVPIVPFASVGVEDMFEIIVDADDILRSPVGDLLRALGILFGAPISTEAYAGRHEDRDACYALREQVKTAIESQIQSLREVREADPERYPMQRLLRRLSSSLG